jgi:hypothetical protein
MKNYKLSKIYKIESNQTEKIYIGSTTVKNLCTRICQHRQAYNKYLKDKIKYISSFEIVKYPDAKIILIQNVECDTVEELRKIEADYIKRLDTVNKNIPGRTDKEYRIDHKYIISEKAKAYRIDNRDILLEKAKEYYIDNRDILLEKAKEYYIDNKDMISEQRKEYYNDNKLAISQRSKEYYILKKQKLKDSLHILSLKLESLILTFEDEINEIDNYIESEDDSSSEDE